MACSHKACSTNNTNNFCCNNVYVVVQVYLRNNLFLNQYKIFWTGTNCFNLHVGQFDFFLNLCQRKKNFLAPSIFSLSSLFSLSPLFLPHLLFPPCSPNIPAPLLNAYLVSLEPQTFGFSLDSCPDALPLSHEDLDASSPIFLITYTQ